MTEQPQVRLTRAYRFSAAHHYYDHSLSESENQRRFGKCANRHGHGHDYRVEITLRGRAAPDTGMLIDLRDLDRLVRQKVLEPLDHRNLNLEVDWFGEHMPTAENLAVYVWGCLARPLAGKLERVRVHESEALSAEYDGDRAGA
jgi:6-pyruvoyltetrahydropterin/6-carboxytetrahydropterin synthase